MSRFLLRSEAIASSRIEGITPSARNIALAELSQTEAVRGVSDQARLVANNLTIVSKATSALVTTDHVSVSDLTALHAALLPDQPELHGIRQRQNWIGGSSYHPLAADFVPPDASRLPELLDDIVSYLNGAAHSPLVQAALVHAQFETIHPFSDGNGRVGRALIHTVLARRGLTTAAVLPVSLVLSTLRDRYVAGLMGYRYDGPAHRPEATAGVRGWIRVFVEAALAAAQQSAQVAADIKTLRAGWQEALTAQRLAAGVRPSPRTDSAVARILTLLPSAPVLTISTATQILGVSTPAASAALTELRQAGVLTTHSIGARRTAYMAHELLDMLTVTETRLASTQFDTRLAPPTRAAPATPPAPNE